MADERRRSVRVKKVINIRYTDDKKKWDITAIRDISETGISFTTHKPFSPDDIITFLIKIPTMPLEWLEITGRVVASEGIISAAGAMLEGSFITRVEFVNLQGRHKEFIQQYITWFLSKQGGRE
ncbi:MAG: PilZ domain-containing protein [Candidatus Omnitrophota bacterium]|jgi:c-di-GMP-binding flagellar brake protein YcgR